MKNAKKAVKKAAAARKKNKGKQSGEKADNIGRSVIKAALEILKVNPKGIGYAELCNRLGEKLPSVNPANFRLHVYRLPETHEDVYKPEHGKYRLRKSARKEEEEEQRESNGSTPEAKKQQRLEVKLYPLVADFLRGMDECTGAIPLGGNCFGGKNNTPDVIGVMQPNIGKILDFPIEFISVEVKYSLADAITGFGQACAYRLFSHKSYLVVPGGSEDMGRVESLCNLFGIGLIVFKEEDMLSDGTPPENLSFTVKTRAVKHSPDMFYFKEYPDKYLKRNPEVANKLLRGEAKRVNNR